jgi:hypothetical protein
MALPVLNLAGLQIPDSDLFEIEAALQNRTRQTCLAPSARRRLRRRDSLQSPPLVAGGAHSSQSLPQGVADPDSPCPWEINVRRESLLIAPAWAGRFGDHLSLVGSPALQGVFVWIQDALKGWTTYEDGKNTVCPWRRRWARLEKRRNDSFFYRNCREDLHPRSHHRLLLDRDQGARADRLVVSLLISNPPPPRRCGHFCRRILAGRARWHIRGRTW